jgi:hypothetical protein
MNEKRLIFAVIAMTLVFIGFFALMLGFFVRTDFFAGNRGGGGGFLSSYRPAPISTSKVSLQRPLGLFEEFGDTDYIGMIGPGEFEILEHDGYWYLIATEQGPKWINLDFWPSPDVLADFFASFPYRVSVFYHNLETGFIFGHRDDAVYSSASLNKALHAFYIYNLAELGLADLSRTYVLNAAHWRGGTGVIKDKRIGTEFTHLELLRHSVQDSDNIAFFVLLDLYSDYSPSYNEFYAALGGDTRLIRGISGHLLTASEAGLMMLQIHKYTQTGSRYADHFLYSLLNSDVPIIKADYPIAQKYGHWEGAFHDMAVIHSPSPYILVIMSDMFHHAPFHAFEEISMFIQDFNNKYFVGE